MRKKINIILVCILSIFLLTGCSNKTALQPNDFVDLMEQNEYQTTNALEQLSQYEQIKNAFLAQDKDLTYQIEYYELDTVKNAEKFFDGNVETFKKMSNIKKDMTLDLKNYQKYTQTTDSNYCLVARIDNTIIYTKVDIDKKESIDEIIKKLGY